jgi:hypothetical protein
VAAAGGLRTAIARSPRASRRIAEPGRIPA